MHDDIEVIRELFDRYTELWVRHQMREWGELFTEDGDFITHRGVWWRSRQENVRGHEDVPESVLARKKNYSQTVVGVHRLGPGVMLVHTEWAWPEHVLRGAAAAEGRRSLITVVLVQRAGRWLIRAAQNTRLNGLDDFTPIAARGFRAPLNTHELPPGSGGNPGEEGTVAQDPTLRSSRR